MLLTNGMMAVPPLDSMLSHLEALTMLELEQPKALVVLAVVLTAVKLVCPSVNGFSYPLTPKQAT